MWLGLFIWRKSFSYINIGGVYIIEFTALFVSVLGIISWIVKNKRNKGYLYLGPSAVKRLFLIISILLIFVGLRAAFSSEVNFKGLIPGIYPLYFIIFFLIFYNLPKRSVISFTKISYLLFLLPIVPFTIIQISKNIFGYPELPGQTFIYGVSIALALTYKGFNKYSFVLMSSVLGILLMERATFLNAAFGFGLCFIIGGPTIRSTFKLTNDFIILLIFLIVIGPNIYMLIFGSENTRFDLSPTNMYKFLSSIFYNVDNLGGGINGTRSHRIEMWLEIIKIVSSNPLTFLFGMGFKGEILDVLNVSFRAPHNGFISLFYRIGVIGLTFYLSFLFYLLRILREQFNSNKNNKIAALNVILFGTFIGDILTGTILDSPFTQLIFILSISANMALIIKNEKKEMANSS